MPTDFWEKLLLQSVGPLVTAVVGTLIIGTFVAWITRKAQERRADNQLREERTRAEYQLRLQLIGQMTEVASSLYMATQNFWRKRNVERVGSEELDQHRKELDQQYRASRVLGEVIERRLEAYFLSSDPKVLWHATMDLLTVRYFHLIGLTTDNLLRANAGAEHTGLSVEQLTDQKLVLQTYREKLITSARAVLNGPIRPLAG
ncbi:MAG: hypothetical protein H6R02_643 [Burkholderiaceae bacterium]|jgi:hypothetical protein|nr:hypothetical protein [Burkholderiaceae bacterium]